MKAMKKVSALVISLACLAAAAPLATAAGGEPAQSTHLHDLVTASQEKFTDVAPDHWARSVILKWAEDDRGVLQGNENGFFLPEKELTLGEVSAVLSRYFGYTQRAEAEVTPAWADEYVEKAIAAGVVEASGQVDASVIVTREQAVKYFALAFGIDPVDGATTFADDADIDDAYRPYVNAFQRLGYVNGKGNNDFDPKASYTRAEAVQILENITKPGISGVSAIGFVDTDGAKLSAIAVEYNVDLAGASVDANTYDIDIYQADWNDSCVNSGNGQVGDITKVYINDKPEISAAGGATSGKYVIIEVYTDYLYSSEQSFLQSMAVGVTQKTDLTAGANTVAATGREITNYVAVTSKNFRGEEVTKNNALYGTYAISGIEGYQFYTNLTSYGTPDGPAYHVEDCFDEKDGLYYDFDVSYALYVPQDYDPSGSYAMVVVDNPAANAGTHPLQSVLETRSPALLATDWAQNQVKDNFGLDGLIVVVPVVEARVDDNACTPGQYEALLALWDHIQEEYSIDKDHVYGIGQSVGGMVLMETNRNRDNYFAGILMFENQWAQNYYKDGLFIRNMASSAETAATAPMHYPRTDGDITWNFYYDEQGNQVTEDHDPYNLYYLISDDNIMVMNRSSNNLSNDTWRELSYLYSDLVGYSIDQCIVNSADSIEDQEAAIQAYLDQGSTYNGQEMGLRWVTFENGSNGYSARKVNSGYAWLLSQSRTDEMSRSKLDVNKPFELADTQIQDESRQVVSYTDQDGNPIYYKTGKAGAGTQFYNTSWLNLTTIADAAPGWLPEGMSWETGVKAAAIEGVTAITDGGKLTAVAIEYSTDMKDIVVNLKGDDIIGLDGTVRQDIKIVLDPYDFYDADGKQIDAAITNIYVSDSATVRSDAQRGSGSGNYVIVELDTDAQTDTVGVIQRTTIRTNDAIATATATLYK
jgi:predicted peptidase